MRVRWWTPLLLMLFCPLMGVAIGAGTNFINGQVSPTYFCVIMGWDRIAVGAKAVGQGMFEGGILGSGVGLILTISTVASTGCRCTAGLALIRAIRACGIMVVCWIIGGLGGLLLYSLADAKTVWNWLPETYNYTGETLARFLWVGGTIWGAYAGTGLGLLYAAVALHLAWKRRLSIETPGFAVDIVNNPASSPANG